ncbi:MAG: tetratricopeptide repeat protein [Verrucomicrobia bacterium]|nr:tetratricopeptide repeat protein [Verrucomicrobiota bacterium]
MASSEDHAPVDFWTTLLSTLRIYKRFLLAVPKTTVLLLCLGSVLPALFMTIRWSGGTEGRMVTAKIVAGMFHGLHAFFLIVCLWMALDLPLSPRRLGVGFSCLPLYYLGALSAGYFSGYFLLVFGARPSNVWRRTRPLARLVNGAITIAVWVVLVGVPGFMLYQSLPYILWSRTGALTSLATQFEWCLPPPGAVILGDNPFDLLCLQTTLIRRRQQTAYLTADVSSLVRDPAYFGFLQQRHPEFNLAPPPFHVPSDLTNSTVLTAWIEDLVAARGVYYLHPFQGLLSESFSSQPHGLFYRLKPCEASVFEEGPLPPEVVAENQAFWQAFIAKPLPELARHIPSPEQLAKSGASKWLRPKSDRGPERDPWAAVVGSFYSRALDNWGVELQKAGLLGEAGNCFAAALQLSPDNAAAQLNRDFNRDLQAHKPAALQLSQPIEARLGKRRSLSQVLVLDGAIDEPNVCYKAGTMLAKANLPRQAARQFARAQTLAPGYPGVALRQAEQLIRLADYTNALAAANQALQLKPLDADALFWKGLSLILLKDYAGAVPLLSQSLTIQTNSRTATTLGFTHVQLSNLDAARQAYEQAAQSRGDAYQAYFRLAQVANLQKDTNAALKYLALCRSNAPPNHLDVPSIDALLDELRRPTVGAAQP